MLYDITALAAESKTQAVESDISPTPPAPSLALGARGGAFLPFLSFMRRRRASGMTAVFPLAGRSLVRPSLAFLCLSWAFLLLKILSSRFLLART